MVTPTCSGLGSNQDARYPDAVSLKKEAEITKLIGTEWFMKPTEEEVDQAFAIAKTIESPTVLHFMLSDICNAYLKLSTVAGCKKAYEVAKYKEKLGDIINRLLEKIVGVCVRLETQESICFAEKIFDAYPRVAAISFHRNAFYAAQARLEDAEKQKSETVDVNDSDKKAEKPFIMASTLRYMRDGNLIETFDGVVHKTADSNDPDKNIQKLLIKVADDIWNDQNLK